MGKLNAVAIAVNWVSILGPLGIAAYRQMSVTETSLASQKLIWAYVIISIIDYSVLGVFVFELYSIFAIGFMLLVFVLPRGMKSNSELKEWAVSVAVIIDLFMQHIMKIPFKKVGVIKLILAGLNKHYSDMHSNLEKFTYILTFGLPFFACIRYYLSVMRSVHVREDLAHKKRYVEQSGLYLTRLDAHAEPTNIE